MRRLWSQGSLDGGAVVAIHPVAVALDAAALRTAARRGGRQGRAAADEHRLAVVGAGIGSRFPARVPVAAERRVALHVLAVDDVAPRGPPASAPQREATAQARERLPAVGRAGVVDGKRARAGFALGGHGVVAVVGSSVARATPLAAARDLAPGPRTGRRSALGRRVASGHRRRDRRRSKPPRPPRRRAARWPACACTRPGRGRRAPTERAEAPGRLVASASAASYPGPAGARRTALTTRPVPASPELPGAWP